MRILLTILAVTISLILTSCSTEGKKNQKASENEIIKKSEFATAYIGTYTKKEGHVNGRANGIYTVKMNKQTGELTANNITQKVINPSFLSKSHDGKHLYAVSELSPSDNSFGQVFAFRINEDNSLRYINKKSTENYAPCHVATDKTGKLVFVTNYVGGIAMLYKVGKEGDLQVSDTLKLSGSSVHADQESSHLHEIVISSDNNYAFIPDKGSDKIWSIPFDVKKGTFNRDSLSFVKIQDGAGPRHLVFSKDNKFAYVITELDNQINILGYKGNGILENIAKITSLPDKFKENSYGSEIVLHPSGKYLYASNRGHNSIVAFEVDNNSGLLKLIDFYDTKGDFPRGFAIESSGRFLYVANQNTDTVVQFNIDQNTGKLEFSGNILKIKTPVDIEF